MHRVRVSITIRKPPERIHAQLLRPKTAEASPILHRSQALQPDRRVAIPERILHLLIPEVLRELCKPVRHRLIHITALQPGEHLPIHNHQVIPVQQVQVRIQGHIQHLHAPVPADHITPDRPEPAVVVPIQNHRVQAAHRAIQNLVPPVLREAVREVRVILNPVIQGAQIIQGQAAQGIQVSPGRAVQLLPEAVQVVHQAIRNPAVRAVLARHAHRVVRAVRDHRAVRALQNRLAQNVSISN